MARLEEYLLPSLTTSAREIPGAQMIREQATPKDCPLTSNLTQLKVVLTSPLVHRIFKVQAFFKTN